MENAIVLACDQNYAPYALFLANQIALMHPARDFDICIFSQDEIAVPEKLQDLKINIVRIPGGNPFCNALNMSRHGAATYLRLMIPAVVSGRYKRILYLDSDIYLGNPGIDRLFKVDMLDSSLAAVRDNLQWRTPDRHVPEFKSLGLPPMPYFNAGVLLIDVARYQSEQVLEQCLQLSVKHPKVLRRHDQSLLNLVMKGKWAELSPVWNWQYTWSSRFFADLAEPQLIHFIGPQKPWKDSLNALPPRYRRAYSSFINTHYPAKSDMAKLDANAIGWPNKLGRNFLKHWLSVPAMKQYLYRFNEDMVTYKAA